MGLRSRTFECEVEGERFKVRVHRNGSYDVEWLDCPSENVPSGFSGFQVSVNVATADELGEEHTAPEKDDPRTLDEMIVEDIRNWYENSITEDGRCACCTEYDAMRANDLLDREFEVTIDGREWHVKVWQDVWEAELADGSDGYANYRNTDLDISPEERAREDEAFTDEGIIRYISENYVPSRRGLSRFFNL